MKYRPFEGLPSYRISTSNLSPGCDGEWIGTMSFVAVVSKLAGDLLTVTLWMVKPTESNDSLEVSSRRMDRVWVTTPKTFLWSTSKRRAILSAAGGSPVYGNRAHRLAGLAPRTRERRRWPHQEIELGFDRLREGMIRSFRWSPRTAIELRFTATS